MTPIFVFGSNQRGIHGAGAALTAKQEFGAEQGVAEGRTGNAYAIPTKETPWITRDLDGIRHSVNAFLDYARQHPELTFQVTRIGCGLAGYHDRDIAPMFKFAPTNCILDPRWELYR